MNTCAHRSLQQNCDICFRSIIPNMTKKKEKKTHLPVNAVLSGRAPQLWVWVVARKGDDVGGQGLGEKHRLLLWCRHGAARGAVRDTKPQRACYYGKPHHLQGAPA